jgi:phospholipase/carboxylesterase
VLLPHHHIAPRAGAGPAPTLILLHGLGANERDLVPVADALPDTLRVFLLRAPEPATGIPGGFQWYQRRGPGDPEPGSWESGLKALHESIASIRHDPGVDRHRLLLGGFSQGAMMSANYAARHPEAGLRAVILLSGFLPDTVAVPDLTGLSVFFAHGLQDPVLPVAGGERMADRLKAAGAHVERHLYPIGHYVSPEEMRDLSLFIAARL